MSLVTQVQDMCAFSTVNYKRGFPSQRRRGWWVSTDPQFARKAANNRPGRRIVNSELQKKIIRLVPVNHCLMSV